MSTSLMVVGLAKASELVETLPGIEAYFIYADSLGNIKTSMSSGFASFIKEEIESEK